MLKILLSDINKLVLFSKNLKNSIKNDLYINSINENIILGHWYYKFIILYS